VIVRFVDISGIVDHFCLNCTFRSSKEGIDMNSTVSRTMSY